MNTDGEFKTIDTWYDRSMRLWTCLWLDENGYQLGVAQYAPRRAEMEELVKRMKVTGPKDYQV
jgi:hypothetical protein